MKLTGRTLACLTLVLTTWSCADSAETVGPPDVRPAGAWSVDSATVAFTARREGNIDVYLLQADGAAMRLTTDPAQDNMPRFSPDGTRLAFQSRRAGGRDDIFIMPVAGGEPAAVNLTDDPGFDVLPAWAPDGARLAFMSTRGFELGQDGAPFPGHIYIVNLDGTGLRQVTRTPLTSSLGPQAWTPDATGLLLSREVDGQLDLFLLDVASGDETRLTTDPSNEYGASISPDGTLIAFHAETPEASQLVIMSADGTGRRALTSGPGRRYSPRWSPDGLWVLFTAEGEGEQYDLRAINFVTGEERAVVATSEDEREGDWRAR